MPEVDGRLWGRCCFGGGGKGRCRVGGAKKGAGGGAAGGGRVDGATPEVEGAGREASTGPASSTASPLEVADTEDA